jgi:hypothetical protein
LLARAHGVPAAWITQYDGLFICSLAACGAGRAPPAADMYGWYAVSIDSDVYSRHSQFAVLMPVG